MSRSISRPWVVLALLYLGAGSAVHGESQSLSPRDLWPQVMTASERGDHPDRDAKLADLFQSAKNLGIRRFPLFTESATSLSRRSEKEGNAAEADWWLAAARKLDPLSADVEFTAADLARGRRRWPDVARFLVAGIRRVVARADTAALVRANLILVLALSMAALAVVFAIVLFARYYRVTTHDLREIFGRRFRPGVATVMAFATLFLPLFLWLGPMWLVLFWLAIFFSYASTKERFFIVVLLLSQAAIPVTLDWTAYRVAGVGSPVIRASLAALDRSYDPEVVSRLRDLIEAVPDEPKLFLLLGNLELEQGDEQGASLHYHKALELDDRLAGAHLNLGNLHFLVNDLQAATLEYEKASQDDPKMAIADYNRSVASGEMYKFDEQGNELEQAKRKDRAMIDHIIAEPPPQKIAMYQLPLQTAWALFDELVEQKQAHDVFGNFGVFRVGQSFLNPLSIGSLLALALAVGIWFRQRRGGVAGECIKCGRTFCHRCKSAHESATYCTQCIHIYLKRDGVSLDTKRTKLAEVQSYQTGSVRKRRILTTFLPGSGQILADSTISGTLGLFLFLFLVSIAVLAGGLAPLGNPAETMKWVLRITASTAALLLWLLISIPVYKQRIAA
jgi:tetratricopeptide (TPR) repeat protein